MSDDAKKRADDVLANYFNAIDALVKEDHIEEAMMVSLEGVKGLVKYFTSLLEIRKIEGETFDFKPVDMNTFSYLAGVSHYSGKKTGIDLAIQIFLDLRQDLLSILTLAMDQSKVQIIQEYDREPVRPSEGLQ